MNFPTDADNVRAVEDFRQGLRENGLVEGRDVAIRWSWAQGRGHPWAKEETAALVTEHVDVIVVAGSLWRTVREQTGSIPIVMMGGNGELLVSRGWAANLAEPGGYITGLTFVPNQAHRKRLEYLVRLAPTARRIAVMTNFDSQGASVDELKAHARQFGLDAMVQDVRQESQLASAFARAAAWGADALDGEGLTPTTLLAPPVTSLALRHRLPSVFGGPKFVEAGGLMYYGAVYPDNGYLVRRAAWYVSRILDGVAPGKLPIEVPTGIWFFVNKRTLAALGLTVPSDIALQVTTWIE